jgi:hypothetical protein
MLELKLQSNSKDNNSLHQTRAGYRVRARGGTNPSNRKSWRSIKQQKSLGGRNETGSIALARGGYDSLFPDIFCVKTAFREDQLSSEWI